MGPHRSRILFGLSLAACAADVREGGERGSGLGSLGESAAGDESGDAASTGDAPPGSGSSGAADDGTKFDLPPGAADEGTVPDGGCEKVDFLFVIDSSISMTGEQDSLVASFPGFITAIGEALAPSSDYHIMVVDTDAQSRCPTACAEPQPNENETALCVQPAGGYACSAQFDDCDVTLGAGVVHPAGADSSNQLCAPTSGGRWLDSSEPALDDAFECVARVGTAGDDAERPMDALRAALAPGIAEPGACNEGFLRDDAILVVTFISDDPCYEDAGAPQAWYDDVVAAKGGDADAIVVLGIVPGIAGCHASPNALSHCADPDHAPAGAHWVEFVELWGDHGSYADVCATDYAPFFAEAVAVIDTTCDEFEPPG